MKIVYKYKNFPHDKILDSDRIYKASLVGVSFVDGEGVLIVEVDYQGEFKND